MRRYQFEDSILSSKYRELIVLTVAANLKCAYCQAIHLGMAKG